MARFKPTPTDMLAAAQMLQTLAHPLDRPVYLSVKSPHTDVYIRIEPYLADLLRELFCYVARGEAVTVMNTGPQGLPEEIDTL